MVGTIMQQTKGKAKKRPKDVHPIGIKERRKLIPLMVGNYFTHNPLDVVCMQIMRSKNNKRLRTNISCQCNLPFYSKGKAH